MNDREPGKPSVFSELRRRNVVRAAVLYAGAVWVVSQGIAQLSPALGLPDWATRAFLVAAVLGLPFWIAFAWIYELTPQGIRRESEVPAEQSISHHTGRKLDLAIIATLAVAVAVLGWRLYAERHAKTAAPVAAVATAAAADSTGTERASPAPAAGIPEKSVAVLPFANESGKQGEQFFSDGLSDDLINALSQFDGLKVISRNSAFQFRDSKDSSAKIGKLLGVAHLLEGSVQRAGDEVRITATLVNASDGSIVWSQRYDKPYKDLFALQDDITRSVADALKAKLLTAPGAVVQSDRPPSGNLAAYAAYQHGKAYEALVTEAGDRKAVDAFMEAIRLDPKYAAAYAQLSETWVDLVSQFVGGSPQIQQANAEARKAADAALKLDPNSSFAHQAHSKVLLYVDMNWSGAEAEAERALQLAPNNAAARFNLGRISASLGRNQRAVALTRLALANDPRHALWYSWLSINLAGLGRLSEAKRAIETAIALQPGAVRNHERLTIIEILRGDPKAALAAAQKELPPWHDIAVTMALQTGVDRTAADGALKKLVANYTSGAPYQIAQVYALRGDADDTFKWLDRAWFTRDPGIGYLLMDPLILRYRHDPRFAAFCKRVGLPTTTDAVAMK